MKKPNRQQSKLQKQTPETAMAEPYAHRRTINTNFLFWTVCEDRACARARACVGDDVSACFNRCWPAVPEEMKVQLRAYVVGAGAKGMSRDEALAYAQGEVARWKADQEKEARAWEALQAPAIVPEPAETPVNPPVSSGPRLRRL